MRETILNKAMEMFLAYGFKSVTMDDIAAQLGISKKTIYQHFANKTDLVEACTLNLFESISCGIDNIREQGDRISFLPAAKVFSQDIFVPSQ